MIIADTNLIAYLFFETIYSEQANSVHQADPMWACPVLWRSEFVNVVSLYLRKKAISYQDAVDAIDFAQRTIDHREFQVSPYSVLELVSESKCSSYDCEFVALAKEQGVNLVTYDKKIIEQFPDIAISAEDFLIKFEK